MAILCLNPDSIFRPKLVRIFIRGRQTPAYHINTLFEIVQVLADILQLDLVRQSLMTPQIILHLGIHVMDFGVAPFPEGVQRCFVTILDLLQLFGQLSVGLQEFKLPQDRKIREMCLHLGGMKIIQIVQHRPQLVKDREYADEAVFVKIHIPLIFPCS